MARFICGNCNYKFNRDNFNLGTQCPYCGKKGVVKREATASELLSEIDSLIKEA